MSLYKHIEAVPNSTYAAVMDSDGALLWRFHNKG